MAVIRMNFLSQCLGMQTNVTICLPSCSFKDRMDGREDVYVPGMKYQVLWLLHGGTGDDSDFLHFTNITRYADDHKLAVVMPNDYMGFYDDEPNGIKYRSYIGEELPKMLQALFPFSDRQEDNFIGGLSMGGDGVLKLVSDYPNQYGTALVMSTSFGVGDILPSAEVLAGRSHHPHDTAGLRSRFITNARDGHNRTVFWLSYGSKDHCTEQMKSHHAFLQRHGYASYIEEVPGYGHEWDFWDLTLRKAINEWLPVRHSVIYPGEE